MAERAGERRAHEQGIRQLEKHRESLPAGAARWGAFHTAEELFDEAVDLALLAGDPAVSFHREGTRPVAPRLLRSVAVRRRSCDSAVLRNRGEERRVGVAEIAKLPLDRTSVVVLAGCDTARGQRRAAEGVISVAHGFLSVGVPSAIATLWPIDDQAAAVFFPRLHEKFASGMAPAEALRAVQLEAIQSGDIPLSLWAAVQVIGS